MALPAAADAINWLPTYLPRPVISSCCYFCGFKASRSAGTGMVFEATVIDSFLMTVALFTRALMSVFVYFRLSLASGFQIYPPSSPELSHRARVEVIHDGLSKVAYYVTDMQLFSNDVATAFRFENVKPKSLDEHFIGLFTGIIADGTNASI